MANYQEPAAIDNTTETNHNNNKTNDTTKVHTNSVQLFKTNAQKPPPLYVQKVESISKLIKELNNLPNCKYELKVLKDNEIRIQPAESTNYTSITKLLKEQRIEYYTFKPKDQRGFRVILRNMHHSTDKEEIKKELAAYGHDVTNIHNILQAETKKPLPLFSIEIKASANNKEIYSITKLMHCKIVFEPPHQKRTLPQCTNCQKYGHTKNFCNKSPVCVKCAGNHKTLDCPNKENNNNIKCALCGENHTANYKGCMVYKTLKIKRYPALRQKETPQTQTTDNIQHQVIESQQVQNEGPQIPYQNTKQLTYAQVAAPNTFPTEHQNMQNDKGLADLKSMIAQLITQISNMMNVITMLINKLNEQK